MGEFATRIDEFKAEFVKRTDDVPAGYKQSEVGVIPEDWEVKRIEEIASVTNGKRLPLGSSLVKNPTPYPYIRVTDMGSGTVSLSDILFVPESVFPTIRQYRIFRDDIFISVAGTIGIVGRIPVELDGANLTENANRITEITCSRDFLLYALNSTFIQKIIDSIRTVGAQPKLALGRIRQFTIPIPQEKREQRAIAEALSDVDSLLESLDALIAKKRAIKQAAMQQLLTGETRLPGFTKEWEPKLFGEVVSIRNEKVLPCHVDPGTICVELEHIASGEGQLLRTITSQDAVSSKYKFSSGDVLFGRLRPYLRKYCLTDCDGICTTEIWPLVPRPGKMVSGFLFGLIQSEAFIEAANVSYGTHMPRADWGVMREFDFLLPSPEEQTAIAAVLSDMDSEITALEQHREKIRAIKQAMMQQLLTGRIRLV